MKAVPYPLAWCLALGLTPYVQGTLLHSASRSLRNARRKPGAHSSSTHFISNREEQSGVSLSALADGTFTYSKCDVTTKECTVNAPKIAADLAGKLILFLGSSLDIYALDYFCKAAGVPVTGFTRTLNNTVADYAKGNFAYCQIGGLNGKLTLAYSFHPGASGPPYYKLCSNVLKNGPCQDTPALTHDIVQQSVAQAAKAFSQQPTAIVVDSTLWDSAGWWEADGRPKEPYIAPAWRLDRWCSLDFPAFVNMVQASSPTSKVAFRTAPRIEYAPGFGHSTETIAAMNQCLMGSTLNKVYTLVDYNTLVEMFLKKHAAKADAFYEDRFHPAGILSVLYMDWVLQWAR